jgi:ketosteroid isomerase-like protein
MVDDADVALVRRSFHAFNERWGELETYYSTFFTPDAVVELVDGFPLSGRYEGFEGYRRFFEESYGPYQDVRRRLDSVAIEGDRVVALLTISGRSKEDPVELEVEMGNTYEIEDGRIRHLRVYLGHERAIDAARAE